MIQLKFNAEELFDDLVDKVLVPAANEVLESVYKDIKKSTEDTRYIKKRTFTPIEIDKATADRIQSKITGSVISYGWTILLSYGSGTKLDLDNEDLIPYIGSKLWNPARHGFEIVGRPKGSYTNFFGEQAESEGNRTGKGIGGWGKGIKPNYAIQNAEKRLDAGLKDGGYVHRILDKKVDVFFDTEDLDKYFIEVKT